MRKGRDLLGIPILEDGSGQRLGEIQDVVVDPDKQVVNGFLLAKGSWFHSAKQIKASAVHKVEIEAIKVQRAITKCEPGSHFTSEFAGKKVRTAQGKELGTVQDVMLDDECQRIVGYEISDGFISDLVTGRAVVHRINVLNQDDDYLVVEDRLENIWEI